MAASPGQTPDQPIAAEQAALRLVAVLVARVAPPGQVFAAVTEQAGQLLGAHAATLSRYEADGTTEVVAAWSKAGDAIPIGTRWSPGQRDVHRLVFEHRRAERIDGLGDAPGMARCAARQRGVHTAIAVPVSVEGRLWGVMSVASTHHRSLPSSSEARLTGFTELIATAIATAQARLQLRGFAEEQAALRRVATLAAQAATPKTLFDAVAEEAGRVLDCDFTFLSRYDPGDAATIVASWSRTRAPFPAGTRLELGGRNLHTRVFQTSQAARTDDYAQATGAAAGLASEFGLRSGVAVPITVEGRLWGVMSAAMTRQERLPADAEARLAGFTDLVATAIANAQTRLDLRGFAEEQAALRRVATLVATGATPEQVFTAVADEAGQLLNADYTVLSRYDPDRLVTVVGGWTKTDPGRPLATGLRLKPEGRNIHALVLDSGRSARIDDYAAASGAFANVARDWEFRASVGAPIRVEDRLWGVLSVASRSVPLPPDTEARLAGFTELAATAIGNAEVQAGLTASRVRIVEAADQTRRKIERDLHEGAQRRLASLALQLREARAAVPPGADQLAGQMEEVVGEVTGVLEELRELARGLHPAILSQGGLRPALRALARRSAVPVSLDIQFARRLPEPVETAAYYAVSEALANTAKHAHARAARVVVSADEGMLRVYVRDDGRGGAGFGSGSGLAGLKDRVEALGGQFTLCSPPGAGTTVTITIPTDIPTGPAR